MWFAKSDMSTAWLFLVTVFLWTQTPCQGIENCTDYPCLGAGYCHEEIGSYSCECLPGYSGENCSIIATKWNITDMRLVSTDDVPNIGWPEIEIDNSGVYGTICDDNMFYISSNVANAVCRFSGFLYGYGHYDRYYYWDDVNLVGYGLYEFDCYHDASNINDCSYTPEHCRFIFQYTRKLFCGALGASCNTTDDCGSAMEGITCIAGNCTCGQGYSENTTYHFCEKASIGQKCDENTRCGTDKSQCFGNVCICATGIYNQDDDICDSMMLYPYGDPTETLGNVDDECSTAVTFELGIPIFNEIYTEIYVCSNGLVSLGLPYTDPVPNKDLHFLGNRTVLAAFFSDIETGEVGSVSYKVHSVEIDPDNLSNADVQNVTQILKQNGASDSFDVKFILFSTWNRVKPRQTVYGDTEESTFQLVLASSGIETYAMYIYAHAQMLWTTATLQLDVWVGYVTPGDERYSHPKSFTKEILEMDNNVETDGITGLLLLPLNSAVPVGVTESLECLSWYYDKKRKNEGYKDPVLPECPCDLTTLQLDPRFPQPQLETEGVICSTAWPDPRLLPYGMKCCYGTDIGLFIRDIPDAGGLLSKHPLVDQKYHILNDIIPKQKCCKDPAYCHFYYDVHPIGTCYSRTWFKFGTFWGDPHFRSLDGLNFTFNGWGEYLMLKVHNYELHARTEPVGEHDGAVSNATIFSAFAAKQNNKTLFHVELNSSKTGLILYGSGIDLTRRYKDSDDENAPFNFTSTDHELVLAKWNNTLKVIFTETGISLNISIGVKMLTLNVLAPNTLKNQTSGLLGNFDGSADNDFITPDAQTHSSDMNETDIYKYVQLCHLVI